MLETQLYVQRVPIHAGHLLMHRNQVVSNKTTSPFKAESNFDAMIFASLSWSEYLCIVNFKSQFSIGNNFILQFWTTLISIIYEINSLHSTSSLGINHLPHIPILGSSSSAATKNTRSKIWINGVQLSDWVENIVGKEEIACDKQFLLFLQCFQKLSVVDASKQILME